MDFARQSDGEEVGLVAPVLQEARVVLDVARLAGIDVAVRDGTLKLTAATEPPPPDDWLGSLRGARCYCRVRRWREPGQAEAQADGHRRHYGGEITILHDDGTFDSGPAWLRCASHDARRAFSLVEDGRAGLGAPMLTQRRIEARIGSCWDPPSQSQRTEPYPLRVRLPPEKSSRPCPEPPLWCHDRALSPVQP